MRRNRGSGGVPWRGLLVAATVAVALTVGLVRPAAAATRFVATTGSNAGPNTCLASGSPCKTITHTLTQAVTGDTVSVAAGTFNLALGETFPLTINKTLTLTGAGAGSTIIDATGANRRVILVDFGVTATISGVTITGGAQSCSSSGCETGGGGLLTLENSAVDGNTASCASTGFACNASGGGLLNDGALTVTNATVTANTVTCSGAGCTAESGGLWNEGTLTLTNSTVSGNIASCTTTGSGVCNAGGGGLANARSLTVTNATVTANTVTCNGVGCTAQGGGLNNGGGTTTLKNTIVAKQLAGPTASTPPPSLRTASTWTATAPVSSPNRATSRM